MNYFESFPWLQLVKKISEYKGVEKKMVFKICICNVSRLNSVVVSSDYVLPEILSPIWQTVLTLILIAPSFESSS